jgi:hypothetical protein
MPIARPQQAMSDAHFAVSLLAYSGNSLSQNASDFEMGGSHGEDEQEAARTQLNFKL